MDDEGKKCHICLKRKECVCASAYCRTHDCQSASDLLYYDLLKELRGKAYSIIKEIGERSAGLKKDYDRLMSKRKVNEQQFVPKNKTDLEVCYKLRDHKSKLTELNNYMFHIDSKLKSLEHSVNYATALELDKQVTRIQEQMNSLK